MGSVLHFDSGRRKRREGTRVPPVRFTPVPSKPSNVVHCEHCGERHPLVRLAGGETRCVTAFSDGMYWFCRNRGCRRAWMDVNGKS